MTPTHVSGVSQAAPISKKRVWTGWILWGLSAPFMLLDSVLHIAVPGPVLDASQKLGIPVSLMPALGIVELLCLVLYVIPRTSIIGAILLTGYLGGAVAIQLRVGGPFPFAIFIGVLLWGALYCRDERVRAFIA